MLGDADKEAGYMSCDMTEHMDGSRVYSTLSGYYQVKNVLLLGLLSGGRWIVGV